LVSSIEAVFQSLLEHLAREVTGLIYVCIVAVKKSKSTAQIRGDLMAAIPSEATG
jgi:hypothetical protein